ncbi:PIG-L family deacetylase [Streptomyces sp. KR80]|uniref:PIG-L family deacetylase n=1 Tax=Streptomyces sp. KR80 TaxID=3457426 RepID=UPI003FD0278D
MSPISRRRVLTSAVTLALTGTVAACTASLSESTAGQLEGGGAATADQAATLPIRTKETVLHVVAHPDDDLYFMNPDLGQSLRSGNPVVTVYLTAGQSDGINAPAQERQLNPPPADRAAFAKARQNGIRAAYARIATGDRTSSWRREVIPTAGGGLAELDTLENHPQIRLIWLQLHEAESVSGDQPHSLRGLWDGRTPALRSLLATGSLVTRDFAYTKEQLIATLAGLMERFAPTFVRMQDPTPDHSPGGGWIDHQDHIYGARFVQQALARYTAADARFRPRVGTQVYLGYLNGFLPHALGPAALRAKLDALETYGWADGYDCRDPAGCGDRGAGAHPLGSNWAPSTRYHRGESTTWLQPGKNGALRAFAVLDGRLAVWSRPTRGSAGQSETPWSGPELLPGAGIDDGVTAVGLPDGRIAVFATRTVLGAGPADYRREVVTTVQTRDRGTFGPWQSLGAPAADNVSSWQLSAPVAAVDGSGRLMVCVRNGVHGLSSRTQRPDGGWQPWTGLGGSGLLGSLAAATDMGGRIHVVASTATSVLAWSQSRPGGPLSAPLPTGLPPTTGPLTAYADGPGIRLYFRRPGTADVLTALSPEPGRSWGQGTADLGGHAGFGPVAVATDGSRAVLATRNDDGTLSAVHVLSVRDDSRAPRWSSTGFLFGSAPAAAPYGPSEAALAVVGLDSRLYWKPGGDSWRPATTG